MAPSKIKVEYRIPFTEDEKIWIFSQIGQAEGCKMELVYDGEHSNFDPTPLLKVVQKQQLLFIL